MRLFILVVVFTLFTGWSLGIVHEQGLSGLASLLKQEPWSQQLLVDLIITSVVAWLWLGRDARQRGIAAWPYIVATVAVGSIGILAYLLHRELRARRTPARPS